MKARRPRPQVSLGTFPERDAQAIASALRECSQIVGCEHAVHERLVTPSGPTEWWHVYVPTRAATAATAWVAGWRMGLAFGRIEHECGLSGATFEVTARILGYLPRLPLLETESDDGDTP